MIVEFSVSNYRSIKSEQVLSLIAENTNTKEDNTCEVILANGTPVRLLRSAIIYGANASGKSNIIKAAYGIAVSAFQRRRPDRGV
jgi:uncharacterized protein